MMSRKKLFLLLTFFMLHAGAYAPSSQRCHEAFIAAWVQKVFSNFKSYKRYRGQKGYLLFMQEKTPNIKSMDYVFNQVSKALGEDFKSLGWQAFHGSVEEFYKIREWLVDERAGIKEEYQGMEGYVRFSEEHYDGDMQKAFINVSSVLSKEVFKKLGWQKFQGSVKEFKSLSDLILDERGEIKEEYQGMEGYAHFATRHHDGDMFKAFLNASSVLGKAVLKKSGWQGFKGSVKGFYKIRKWLVNEEGRIKEEYQGMEGYARFATKHYNGDMFKAFLNASSVLSKAVLKKSGWQAFQGSVEGFYKIREWLVDKKGRLKENYQGMKGYARFSEEYYDGDMLKAFLNASSVLSEAVFKRLGWQGFQGSVKEFKSLSDLILDERGEIKEEYQGMEGYAHFAEEHYAGDMKKAFMNVSSVFSKAVLKKSGWQAFLGSVEGFYKIREWLLDEKGRIKEEYKGMEGYVHFSEEYYNGDMSKAFINVSSLLGGFRNIREEGLGWKIFKGTAGQFHALTQLFEKSGAINFQGPEGLKTLADKIFKGHQKNTYKNVSVLRDFLPIEGGFKALDWPVIR